MKISQLAIERLNKINWFVNLGLATPPPPGLSKLNSHIQVQSPVRQKGMLHFSNCEKKIGVQIFLKCRSYLSSFR